MSNDSWDARIARADALAAMGSSAAALLAFYAAVLRAQRAVDVRLRSHQGWTPTGSLQDDLPNVRGALTPLFQTVAERGSQPLAVEAGRLLAAGAETLDAMLVAYWRAPDDQDFFAKASLQPYARWLAALARIPVDRALSRADNRCPFCGGAPQLAVLQEPAGQSGGSGRALACSLCETLWTYQRIRCPGCGEEDEKKLAYFRSPAFEHVRVDACDTCGAYLKGIDLSRLGTAVPGVDEIAAAPLDAWARERGYTKIERNLVGL